MINRANGGDTGYSSKEVFLQRGGCVCGARREITRERIMAGIERARKEKKHLGRPPGKKTANPGENQDIITVAGEKEENLNSNDSHRTPSRNHAVDSP